MIVAYSCLKMEVMQYSEWIFQTWGITKHPARTLPMWIVYLLFIVFMVYGQVS